jgi:hypothetical protein
MEVIMLKRWGRALVSAVLSSAIVVTAGRSEATAQPSPEVGPKSHGIEFGATSGVLVMFPTFGVRMTGVVSSSLAVEGAAELVPWTLDERRATYQLFQGQLRHTFSRGQRWTWHATYGGTLFTTYTYSGASTSRLPDGSIRAFPEERSFQMESVLIHAGIGGERRLSSGMSFRWDVQALQGVAGQNYPLPRGAIGLTWR